MSMIIKEKTDLEPTVPLAILRLFSVITLVLGMLGGVVGLIQAATALGERPERGAEVASAIAVIIGSIITAALLSVIAAICSNLIEIRKSLSKE